MTTLSVVIPASELTLRDLLDHLEGKIDQRSPEIKTLFDAHDLYYKPAITEDGKVDLGAIKGLVWRRGDEVVVNATRPFIPKLDDLPLPMHELLPLQKYRMPLIKGPFTFIVTSRGCPAACTYCIKHVSYQFSARVRSLTTNLQE